jgi:hypothetical protein
VLHLLGHPDKIVTREQLEGIGPHVAEHLDEILHELDRCHWLATVPVGQRPCCATQFQLRQDPDV